MCLEGTGPATSIGTVLGTFRTFISESGRCVPATMVAVVAGAESGGDWSQVPSPSAVELGGVWG